MGRYEKLNELDDVAFPPYPRFCFTDDPTLTSETWTIRLVEPAFPMDSVRSQRRIKILAHEYLPEFDVSLYVDNAVHLKASAQTIFDTYLQNVDIAVPSHSFHSCVLDEFIAVADHGLDEPARIFEQLNHYQLTYPEILDEAPYWTAILLRRHHESSVRQTMIDWYNQVMRYSRRDQLSLNVAVKRCAPKLRCMEIGNHESWFHNWPVLSGRKESVRVRDFSMAGMSALAQQRLTQLQFESLSSRLRDKEQLVAELSATLETVKHDAEQIGQQFDTERRRSDELRQQLEQERSGRKAMEETVAWRAVIRTQQFLQRHPVLRGLVTRLAKRISAGRVNS